MDLALQQLFLILLGLGAGVWLHQNWGVHAGVVLILPLLGAVAGIGLMYKQSLLRMKSPKKDLPNPLDPLKAKKQDTPSPHDPPPSP